jgi:hypothetical protein
MIEIPDFPLRQRATRYREFARQAVRDRDGAVSQQGRDGYSRLAEQWETLAAATERFAGIVD